MWAPSLASGLELKTPPYLAREFVGQFDEIDLVQQPDYHIYLRLMIDGSPSLPFSVTTLKAGDFYNPIQSIRANIGATFKLCKSSLSGLPGHFLPIASIIRM